MVCIVRELEYLSAVTGLWAGLEYKDLTFLFSNPDRCGVRRSVCLVVRSIPRALIAGVRQS